MACRDGLATALTNAKRRAIVKELQPRDQPIALADLACDLAEAQRDTDSVPSNGDDADGEHLELYHRHGPALAEIDVVGSNEAKRTIDRGADFPELAELLKTVRESGVAR